MVTKPFQQAIFCVKTKKCGGGAFIQRGSSSSSSSSSSSMSCERNWRQRLDWPDSIACPIAKFGTDLIFMWSI